MTDNSKVPVIASFPVVRDMSEEYGLPAQAFVHTMAMVAMPRPHTQEDLVSCLIVAKEHKLNPITKEIYFMKTRSGQVQPIVSIDGWITKCNERPEFDGFELEDITDDKGKLIGMTCRMYRKDRSRPTEISEYIDECAQNGGPVWKTHPRRMIRNRVYCQCARLTFGFAGIMELTEFQDWQHTQGAPAQPIDITPQYDEPPPEPEVVSARDGGPLPNASRERPKANAFAETGGKETHKEAKAEITAAASIEELEAVFDKHQRDGTAWAEFPLGWARQLQDLYHYARKDLEAAALEVEDAIVEEPDAVEDAEAEPTAADLLERRIEEATDMMTLAELYHEHDAGGVPWARFEGSDREAIQRVYSARLEQLRTKRS